MKPKMRAIVAVVRPFLVDKILDKLRLAPVEALRLNEVQGLGRQKDYLEEYGDEEFDSLFLPKVEISIFVEQSRANEVVAELTANARSGRIGDGKVFVVPVERMIDIETYQRPD